MDSSSPTPNVLPTSLPNRLVRTCLGGWGMAFDGARSVAEDPQILITRGAKTCRDIEGAAQELWRTIASTPTEMLAFARGLLRNPLTRMQTTVQATTEVAEEELEHQVEAALARLGIPTRERIQRLAREIDILTQRIDSELDRLAEVPESTYAL